MYFLGLEYSSAGNAVIALQMQIFFSFLYFNIWKKEKLDFQHILGIIIMLIAALILLFPKHEGFQIGDLFVVVAVMFPPIGNCFQQKARKKVGSETIMFLRSVISFPFILLLAWSFGSIDPFEKVMDSLPLLMINGFVILGFSKILWIEGIHRISVTKAVSLESVAPFFTLFFE